MSDPEYIKIRLQEIIYVFDINLYDLLKIKRSATMEEVEQAYRNQSKFYDPDITGNRDNMQIFEELTLAYKTLISEEQREEYDDYLDSVGSSRDRIKDEGLDPEEIERRKRERGKKRYEEDYDFANEEFYNMFKERTQGRKGASGSKEKDTEVNDMNFNGKDISITVDVNIEDSLFNR